MRITALQQQSTDPQRISVFVDGKFLLGVSALTIHEMGLVVEQEITQGQIQQLKYKEAIQQAMDRALHYLSFRPRSREEVRRHLRRKDISNEIIDAVMERLEQLDLINDHNFTSFWVETRDQFNPRGARALKSELRLKGVKREVVEEMITNEQDEERALQAGRKKALSLARQPNIDYPTFYRRLGSFLQRRGFDYEVTTRIVKVLWSELKEDVLENDDFIT